ncbi:MAG: hypothetical protein ACQEQL_07885 [Pseudomonadota bacterium]
MLQHFNEDNIESPAYIRAGDFLYNARRVILLPVTGLGSTVFRLWPLTYYGNAVIMLIILKKP